MSANKRNWTLVAAAVLFGYLLAMGHSVLATRDDPATVLPLEELRTFTDVFTRIKNNYVEEVDDETLLEHAIRGMLTGLDPHSTYLDGEEFKELRITARLMFRKANPEFLAKVYEFEPVTQAPVIEIVSATHTIEVTGD